LGSRYSLFISQANPPFGASVSYKYDSLRRVTNVVDALGSTTNWYNNQGLLVAVSNAVGQVSKTFYDIEDRATNVVDANGVSIDQTFDGLDRLLTRTYPDLGLEMFAYTARGLTNYVNQLGKTNWYVIDAGRRKTSETNANNEVVKYTYDAASDLLTLTDSKSHVTTGQS